ncbi:Oligopeptide transport system permease protein OppB [Chlamydiales bacterium SCGC AG-110-P3]|nr:Oligopeptide transport system permease protein OppB [Chlamydiales bacterium SCGC AG-110-P3]
MPRIRYLFKRLCYMVVSLFVIVTATFFLMKAVPGDPFSEEQALPEEIMEALRAHYGLNDPWYRQYGRYLLGVLTWDLGPSYKYKSRSVNDIISEGFPVSACLGAEALLISIAAGVALGTIAALKRGGWQDYGAMTIAVIGISVPSFILATLLQYIFALKLGVLPVARWGSWAHTILPAISLAALPTAFIARLTRSNMLDVLQQDYIKTAKAKGLSLKATVWRHGMRNALLPIISYLGQLTANIFVGSFVIERIFGIPGLGQWLINSVTNRDYTVIMGTTVFASVVLLIAIFLVDVLYSFLDPRIEEEAR